MSINRAIILGNCGRDPEIRTTQAGDKVATFSVATSETWKDKTTGERKETTDWHTVVVFNQALVGIVEQYVKKGTRVSVEGSIKTRKWQAQDGSDRWSTEIVVGRFDGRIGLEGQPQGVKREEGDYGQTRAKEAGGGYPAGVNGYPQTPSTGGNPPDDDIPF